MTAQSAQLMHGPKIGGGLRRGGGHIPYLSMPTGGGVRHRDRSQQPRIARAARTVGLLDHVGEGSGGGTPRVPTSNAFKREPEGARQKFTTIGHRPAKLVLFEGHQLAKGSWVFKISIRGTTREGSRITNPTNLDRRTGEIFTRSKGGERETRVGILGDH
jgi:hypothetical protein